MRIATLCLAALMAGSAAASEPPSDGLVVFSSNARVEVDAAGNVVDVQEDATLPVAIGQALEATVRDWKFKAPVLDGVRVGGVTYVRLGACAVPIVGGGYRLAFQYNGNGPLKLSFPAPRYPMDALAAQVGGDFNVTYRVEPDGTAVVEAIEGSGPHARDFRSSLRNWIEKSTHKPELIAGQPVATRLSVPVEFHIGRRLPEQEGTPESPSCQVALGKEAEQDRTVALDSPFKRLATN
ncbi:energy transducer TonB [Lysobacter sp. F6437]|uniref:energy transducer TonB n=1 Tax=Lysobacter sp. F6437 TaxID=3459296 RepID=UPI00403DEAE0